MEQEIVVVGAGAAGLTAARRLVDAGRAVHVVEKGRSVGGRLATRRIGTATLDHGAQFFTVRTAELADTVRPAEEIGLVTTWCHGFGSGDGHARYAVRGGMNRLAKHLAAGVDVAVDTTITAVATGPRGWELRHASDVIEAGSLVLTAPVPQSLMLIDAGDTTLDPAARARLEAIEYHPTLALLVVLDGPSTISPPGGVQPSSGPFSFVADNLAKGISDVDAVTLHVSHERSRADWDRDPAVVRAELLDDARRWFGDAEVVAAQLKRWRYAQPVAPTDSLMEATTFEGRPLVSAGDAFAGAKVEGAVVSGAAAACHLLGRLS